jgi:hypothetical protein
MPKCTSNITLNNGLDGQQNNYNLNNDVQRVVFSFVRRDLDHRLSYHHHRRTPLTHLSTSIFTDITTTTSITSITPFAIGIDYDNYAGGCCGSGSFLLLLRQETRARLLVLGGAACADASVHLLP